MTFTVVEKYKGRAEVSACGQCSLPFQSIDKNKNYVKCVVLEENASWKYLRSEARLSHEVRRGISLTTSGDAAKPPTRRGKSRQKK